MTISSRLLWSVNEYDSDGEKTESGVFLHIGGTRIKVADDLTALESFICEVNNVLADARRELKLNRN